MVVAARLGGGSEMDGETGGQEEVEVGRKRLYTEQGNDSPGQLFGANGQSTNPPNFPISPISHFPQFPRARAIWPGEGCPSLPFLSRFRFSAVSRDRCVCGSSISTASGTPVGSRALERRETGAPEPSSKTKNERASGFWVWPLATIHEICGEICDAMMRL